MRPPDIALGLDLKNRLDAFGRIRAMPGIADPSHLTCFIEQLIDSVRRIKYVTTIRDRDVSIQCTDPTSIAFDPIKAASYHRQNGNIDESFWLTFLAIHFGKNLRTGWNLTRDIYRGLGNHTYWNWERTSSSVAEFRDWLNNNQRDLKENGSFGNHRKYQSLKAHTADGTGATIDTYITWIGDQRSHNVKFAEVYATVGQDRRQRFAYLYNSMRVAGFGRTAKFDYLTMISKLGLADIEPGSTYMVGATGPLNGANMLFGSNEKAPVLDAWLVELEGQLGLYFGMQVLEDALCNWQKNPSRYTHFRG